MSKYLWNELNSVDCKILAGQMWIKCKGYEPNSVNQSHCIFFKPGHRCINPDYFTRKSTSVEDFLENEELFKI